MTEDRLEAIRQRHVEDRVSWNGARTLVCLRCKATWPCDTSEVLAALAAVSAERDALRLALVAMAGLVTEAYSGTDLDGNEVGPTVRIWVPRSTIDRMGDTYAQHVDVILAAHRSLR